MARRALVIGSQCTQLNPLPFVPEYARRLSELLLDPEVGQCLPALDGESGGLLLDPTVDELKTAIRNAWKRAGANGDALLLAFLGHGTMVGVLDGAKQFYFLPRDADPSRCASTSLRLVQFLGELFLEESAGIDGLIVILDACHSGHAVTSAAIDLAAGLQGQLRYEFASAVGTAPAYGGNFTAGIIRKLAAGIPRERGTHIRCEHLCEAADGTSFPARPQLSIHRAGGSDPGLWVARNVARAPRLEALDQAAIGDELRRRTRHFVRTGEFESVKAACRAERCVTLTGVAGAGKSTLLAALTWPDTAPGSENGEPFVHAASFLEGVYSESELADRLAVQLDESVVGFKDAGIRYFARLSEQDRKAAPPLRLRVLGPLGLIEAGGPVRIALDGLDQVQDTLREGLSGFLEQATAPQAPAHLRLFLTARPDTSLIPAGTVRLECGKASPAELRQYFEGRGMPAERFDSACERAGGSWLVARIVADILCDGGGDLGTVGDGIGPLYAVALQRLVRGNDDRWRRKLRPLLGLSAIGVPEIPLALVCDAARELGADWSRINDARDLLRDLRGYVVRRQPGTPEESIGLFHPTFADWLLDPRHDFGQDSADAHRAVLAAIDRLAPFEKHDIRNPSPIDLYAAEKEPEHLFAVDREAEALPRLIARNADDPKVNLARWARLNQHLDGRFGPEHPDTLTTYHYLANWTGESGNAAEGLRLYTKLLPIQERVLGPEHPDTLRTRHFLASWTGRSGNAVEALRLNAGLLPIQERVLGLEHPDTLRTRANLAAWTGRCGNAVEALRQYAELLPIRERVLGPKHPDTLTTRANLAAWTGRSGNAVEALRLYAELLPIREHVLGPKHPDTLRTLANLAIWTGECGNAVEARRLCAELLPIREHVLGPEHPDTLTIRHNLADWTGESGNAIEARKQFAELLPIRKRILGAEHPDTLNTQYELAYWTGKCGDIVEANGIFPEL